LSEKYDSDFRREEERTTLLHGKKEERHLVPNVIRFGIQGRWMA